MGYTMLFTRADQYVSDESEFTENITLGAFEIKTDLEIGRAIGRKHGLALALNAHFRPYTVDKRLLSPVPWNTASVGLRWYW
jgi:hypothetical protein